MSSAEHSHAVFLLLLVHCLLLPPSFVGGGGGMLDPCLVVRYLVSCFAIISLGK